MRGYGGSQAFPGYNAGFHQSGMSGTTGYEQYNQQFNTAQVINHSLSNTYRLLFVEGAGFFIVILCSVVSPFKIVELFPYSCIRGIPPAVSSDIALLPALVNNNSRT